MEYLFFSIFATHNPNWADVQSLLATLLAEEERRMVIEKAREEADRMHASAPNKPIQAPAANAIPTTDPGRDENDIGDKARNEHYTECILAGLRKGELTQVVS